MNEENEAEGTNPITLPPGGTLMGDRLSAEDEQCLLLDLERPRDLGGLAGALKAAAEELRLAWRVRSALGWQSWPDEGRLRNWEADQETLRRAYDAENAKDPQ